MKDKNRIQILCSCLAVVLLLIVSIPLKMFDFILPNLSVWALQYVHKNLEIYLIVLLSIMAAIALVGWMCYIKKAELDDYKIDSLLKDLTGLKNKSTQATQELEIQLVTETQKSLHQSEAFEWAAKHHLLQIQCQKDAVQFQLDKACFFSTELDKRFAKYVQTQFADDEIQKLSQSLIGAVSKISHL